MSIAIESRFRGVEKLVSSAQVKGLDPEVAAYYSKLGCIMICGAIERSLEIMLTERVGARSAPQVNSFLKSFFKRGTNYDCERILQLLYKFDTKWGEDFKVFVSTNERLRSGVASCYAIRNLIAHGENQSLGPRDLKQYYEDSFTLVAEVEKLIRP